jgi:hypothetical protein
VELALEVAAGVGLAGDSSDRWRAALALVACREFAESLSRREVLRQRLLRELADIRAGRCDVEQGAFDGGDAEALAARDLAVSEGQAVEAELGGVAALVGQRDVDRHNAGPQPVRYERSCVTQGAVISAGEQRRYQPASH